MAATKKGEGEKSSIDWLAALEEKVRETTGRLKELAGENAKLAGENEKLGKKVKDLEARLAEGAGEGGGGDEEAAVWREEREEIRGRVEKLTETLEGLLDGE